MDWIAERTLHDEDGGVDVVISLGKPEPSDKGPEWMCPFRIEGVWDSVKYAHGEDPFQTILIALDAIRKALGSSGRRLTWDCGEPGDHGIRRHTSLAWGLEIRQHCERLIDTEEKFYGKSSPHPVLTAA